MVVVSLRIKFAKNRSSYIISHLSQYFKWCNNNQFGFLAKYSPKKENRQRIAIHAATMWLMDGLSD
jgi:hypothetical protein